MELEDPKGAIESLVHRAKDIAADYWWEPEDALDLYDQISELKNAILSNQTNYVASEDIQIME